jgi:hypothetical protein
MKCSSTPLSILLTSFLLTGCYGKGTKISSSQSSDLMIHQLRVELEEIKHHIHTTVVQMNLLTNKMTNSEDILFELKQRELVTQKQTLENNSERLSKIEKKLEQILETESLQSLALKSLEEEMHLQSKSLQQNKKKILEIEKNLLSLSNDPS